MSKAWGNIGAWAAEAERAEAEEREAAAAMATLALPEPQNFPSLKEAAHAKPKKKKMTLTEFHTVGPSSTGLTPDEMIRLPTAPRERSAEEMQYGRLGGGFSSYGRSGQPPNRSREDGEASWGGGARRSYGGGFDDERRGPPSRVSDFDQPSRADEVDNWATAKKPLPSLDSNRSNRYSSLGGGGGGSRADETDNWGAGKKPLPESAAPSRYSGGFGSGFRDTGAPTNDRWARGEVPSERPRLVLAPPKEPSSSIEPPKTNRSNPFGAARPREEILAEKGLDYKKLDLEIGTKATGNRPTSAHSSRPSSAQSNRSESTDTGAKPRPKVNPFGDAKPREVLLEQKGLDWRKIDLDLEHRRVDRTETDEEKILKEEIDSLKKEWEREVELKKKNGEPLEGYEEDQSSIRNILSEKERELDALVHDLDDKVRFVQKGVDRPVSRSGSVSSVSERPPSRSGSIDGSRSMENDRPPSRGTSNAWSRPGNDRRTQQGGRDRGYFTNRDVDRSQARW